VVVQPPSLDPEPTAVDAEGATGAKANTIKRLNMLNQAVYERGRDWLGTDRCNYDVYDEFFYRSNDLQKHGSSNPNKFGLRELPVNYHYTGRACKKRVGADVLLVPEVARDFEEPDEEERTDINNMHRHMAPSQQGDKRGGEVEYNVEKHAISVLAESGTPSDSKWRRDSYVIANLGAEVPAELPERFATLGMNQALWELPCMKPYGADKEQGTQSMPLNKPSEHMSVDFKPTTNACRAPDVLGHIARPARGNQSVAGALQSQGRAEVRPDAPKLTHNTSAVPVKSVMEDLRGIEQLLDRASAVPRGGAVPAGTVTSQRTQLEQGAGQWSHSSVARPATVTGVVSGGRREIGNTPSAVSTSTGVQVPATVSRSRKELQANPSQRSMAEGHEVRGVLQTHGLKDEVQTIPVGGPGWMRKTPHQPEVMLKRELFCS